MAETETADTAGFQFLLAPGETSHLNADVLANLVTGPLGQGLLVACVVLAAGMTVASYLADRRRRRHDQLVALHRALTHRTPAE